MPDPNDPDATLAPPDRAPVPTLDLAAAAASDTQTLPPLDPAAAPVGPPAVPGYAIEGELGRGGMGVVYKARQTRLNRDVALKMVLAGGHAGPQERLRFLAEAEAIAAVQHPGIVQVFDFGTCGDQPYFALEFCPGGSLSAKLAGTPLPPREAAELVERIARAVQAAHDKGIVHRDLKPDNVLFDAAGHPKVTDFGLARKVESDSGLTKTGAIMGTPSYMAPEQAAGKKDVGPAADVYALGAILYECLTGRPPFRAATPLDTVLQVVADDPIPPRKLVPNVLRDAETICLKCLQKEPGKRYATAGALADDLRRFQDGEPIAARPVSWVEKTWKQARRRPRVTTLMFLTAFFAVFAVTTLIQGILRSRAAHAETLKHLADLDREATAARAAEAVADAQRHKAQARLELAVDAVERLFTRVAGEKWSRNPALFEERRQVLEEVVGFYEGFRDEDAKDPLVRRETARAQFRIGGVYVLVAEYPKAAEALGRARVLQEGLVAEFPDDPTYTNELAQTYLFTGHVAASRADLDAGGKVYLRAVEAARAAVAARPADDGFRRTLVECLCSAGHFSLYTDRAAAAAKLREAAAEADRLVRPDAPFASRVLAAYAHISAANAEALAGNPKAVGAHFGKGVAQLAGLKPDPQAPARYRDLYEVTGIQVMMSVAGDHAQNGRHAEAAKLLRKASDAIDGLLAVHPKAIQYRMYKLQALVQEIGTLERLRKSDEARTRAAELFALEEGLLRDSPNLTFIRYLTFTIRSQDLAWRARDGDVARLDEQAAELLKLPAAHSAGGVVRYNVACAYALASKSGTTEDREKRAARAVNELTTLAAAGYFKAPDRVKHLHRDKDLDPIRGRDDYKVFEAGLAAGK